jgi:5'-nucleotidase
VVAGCRQSVADFYRGLCTNQATSKAIASCSALNVNYCQLAGEQCKFIACVDRNVGSFADGRIQMVGQ